VLLPQPLGPMSASDSCSSTSMIALAQAKSARACVRENAATDLSCHYGEKKGHRR